MKKVLSVCLTVILFSISSAYANSYVGIGTGFQFGNNYSGTEFDDVTPVIPHDVKNTLNIYAGYNIIKYFAIEGEYDYGFNHKNITSDEDIKDTYTSGSNSGFVNFVGKLPLFTHHIPFIKVGAGFASYKYDNIHDNSSVEDPHQDTSSNIAKGFTYKIGAGYEFMFLKHHSIVLEYDYVATPKLNVETTNTEIWYPDQSENWTDSFSTPNAGSHSYSTINISYKFTF